MRVTASYDLNVDQLVDLLARRPPRLAGGRDPSADSDVPHGALRLLRLPLAGHRQDRTAAGPCDHHDVKLRDRVGMEHPLKADVGCRNTLFNAVPQTAAEYLPRLLAHGARHLRIEFLDDDARVACADHRPLPGRLEGRREAKTLWRELKATNQYGVTRGPLTVL